MRHVKQLVPVIVLILACGVVFWPLARRGFYVSDDGEWMVIRLSAFYQSLRDGQFPVRFLGRLNNSYGYPVANFLYPGFLYIGSVLHLFGLSFVTSVKFIMAGSIVGAAIWLYCTLRRKFEALAATLGTITFIGSPYLLYDLYKRGSVGEVLAFLPASAGVYSIITNKRWLFTLAVAGLIVSHNTLAVLFLVVFLVMMIVFDRCTLLWPLVIGMGLSAFFWIPALVEKRLVRLDMVSISNPREYFVRGHDLWLIGLVPAISVVALIAKRKAFSRETLAAAGLYGLTTVMALPIADFIWSIRPVAAFIQFPYRMLAVGTVVSPWIVAAVISHLKRSAVVLGLLFLVILAVGVWRQQQAISFVTREEGYYTTNEGTTTVADEYLPRWVNLKRADHAPDRLVFQRGRGTIVYEYLNTHRIVAHIDAAEASLLRFHTIYYPGWGVLVGGRPVPVTYDNPHGFIEVAVPAGKHKVEAEFRETVPRFLADLVSVGSFVAWMIYSIAMRKS